MVDPRLPPRVQDLPPALDLPNRFLIASQFGPGPASVLGTAVPVAETLRMPHVPWAGNVPLETVWRFRQENLGMVVSPEQAAAGSATVRAGMGMRVQTPTTECAGMPLGGSSQSVGASRSPKQTGIVAARQRAAAEASTSESSMGISAMMGATSLGQGSSTPCPPHRGCSCDHSERHSNADADCCHERGSHDDGSCWSSSGDGDFSCTSRVGKCEEAD